MQAYTLEREHVETKSRNEMVDITDLLKRLVRQRNLADGMIIVHCPHTTAAVTINENADPDVKSDMLEKLSQLIPKEEKFYEHDEGNSDSHIKASLVGNSVTVLVERGKLVLGRWQGVYFCEFDGPRERSVMLKAISFAPQNND